MKKFFCERCNKELEYAIVDGYHFGDRLLESVGFIIKINGDKFICEGVQEEHQRYFDDLNKKKWIKAAVKYAEYTDMFECPHCGYDVDNPFMVEDEDIL